MKKKKIIATVLAASIVSTTCYYSTPLQAVNFEGQEDKYMALCSSSNLTRDNKSTCEQFNKYLKAKNANLSKDLATQKESADDTASSLEAVRKQIETLKQQISAKENEIAYLTTSITNLEASIEENTQLLKDRMYSMQSYSNDNTYINFIFGAASFSDMFSRIDSFNELVENDKDLIKELEEQKIQLEEQQSTLKEAKDILVNQQSEQASLEARYTALLAEQKQTIATTQNKIYDYGEMTQSLDAAIDEFNKNAYETPVTNSKPAAPSTGSSNSSSSNSGSSNSGSSNSGSSNSGSSNSGSSNSGNTNTGGGSANSDVLGYNIYKAGYAKLGSRYYWGAQGPTYFDCSGFVYWCLKEAGVSGGRDTAAGYSGKYTGVSWANSKTGDLVCFGSPAYHIGIVVLNADGTRSVMHAGGGDSSTHGDNPNACVKISSLEPGSYYYGRISTIRRVG